jgi:hypothetical protein
VKLKLICIVGVFTTVAFCQQSGRVECKGNCKGQQQGQQQRANATSTATGGASTAENTATTGNEANSQSTTYQDQQQTATATGSIVFHTNPCTKGGGLGTQGGNFGVSLGWGKVDKGCDIRETASEFFNMGSRRAACKVLLTEPSALKAGITMDDCMEQYK